MPVSAATFAVPANAVPGTHPPGQGLIDKVRARAEALGAEVTAGERGLRILALSGVVAVEPLEGLLRVTVEAPDEEAHAMLKGAVEGFLAEAGPGGADGQSVDWQPVRGGKAPRGQITPAEVVSIRRLSPSFTRVRLAGDFTPFAAGGLHFRLLIGPEGAAEPVRGADGAIDWPGGIDAWHRPPYTIRAFDPEARWLDFDIFRHDGGRVTEWCDEARPGDRVLLTGPGGRGVRQAGWLGLVGDETALPVILRAIEAAGPETKGRAIIVIGDAADAQPVDLPAGLTLDWVVRAEGTSPLALLRGLIPPAENRFLFFAGERQQAQEAREYAQSLGLGSGEFLAASYWTEGWVPPAEQRQARGKRG